MNRYFLFSAMLCVAACSSSDEQQLDPQSVAWPARTQVEALIPKFDELARQRVESVVTERLLSERLREEAKRPWSKRLDGGLKYADLLLSEYEANDWALAFASPTGAGPRGEAIVARLERADEDALSNAAYHLQKIATQQETLSAANIGSAPSFALTGAEAELAVEWLEQHPEASSKHLPLVDAMLGLNGHEGVARLAELARAHRAKIEPQSGAMVELEVRLADAALRFARDMRHFNYTRVSWPDLEAAGGGKAIVYQRLRKTLRELSTSPGDTTDAVLTNLRPALPQYDRLVKSLAQYRAMSPWETLTASDLTNATDALRARLHAEGYDTSNVRHALAEYERTRQFVVGTNDPGVLRSLNVPLPERIRQIELTLQRYRETFYRDEPDYVFVNIPDFHAEVYREGELRHRVPVVVGNTERVCDAETQEWRYPNATPVQWAALDHLVLNPWWNVPERLFREEISPRIADQAWLDSKSYEIYQRDGQTHARQRPGPQNALGLVKFIFPNEHSTYMHDTPSKQYFSRPVRAFSHGCVRVQDPLDLASYFMTEYDLGGQERLDRIMELGSTIKVEIPGEIPVFFEYYTVRVDDDGRAWFLADPYRLDEQRLDPNFDPSCSPQPLLPAEPAADPSAVVQAIAGEVDPEVADFAPDSGP